MSKLAELVSQEPGFLPSQLPPNNFVFPKDQPFRVVSIETEVDGNGQLFSDTLYHCGLVEFPGVQPYGWQPEGQGLQYPGFIKRDGSVTGGELVISMLNLTDPHHAEMLCRILGRLRVLEKARVIQYNPNCGGHIHIDAHGFGLHDLWRLNDTFSFIEDPIYRLAGAGKTYSHRTLFKGYDVANHGHGYSNPVVKGPFITVKDCYGKLAKQPRMCGLNYTGYFHRRACKCGGTTYTDSKEFDAVMKRYDDEIRRGYYGPQDRPALEENARRQYSIADYKNCSCRANKNTIEWRVWNSQGNPRILYAWISLMQAVFAHSYIPTGHASEAEVKEKSALAYSMKRLDAGTKAHRNNVQERVEWLFSELPLQPEQKDALAYAFMRSECKEFGASFFKKCANFPTVKAAHRDPYHPQSWVCRSIVAGAPVPVPADGAKVVPPFPQQDGPEDVFHDEAGPLPDIRGVEQWINNNFAGQRLWGEQQ